MKEKKFEKSKNPSTEVIHRAKFQDVVPPPRTKNVSSVDVATALFLHNSTHRITRKSADLKIDKTQ